MESTGLADLAARHGAKLIVRHGSTVSGRVHANSDVDIAVLFADGDPPLARVADLGAGLQRLFPGREVDVAVINHADPLFLKKILENCELLFGTERVLAELRIYAFRRYQDHRRFLSLERPYVRRTLQRLVPR